MIVILIITVVSGAPNLNGALLIPPVVLALALWLWMAVVLGKSGIFEGHRGLPPHPFRSRFPRRIAAVWALASTSLLIVPVVLSGLSRLAKGNPVTREYDPARRAYVLSDQAPVSAIYRFTDLHAAAVEDRLLISAALMITVIAVAVAAMDMSRRRRLAETDRSGPLAPLRRLLLPSLAVSLVLLVIGVILAAGPGALALSRLAGYFDHAKPLSGYGVVKTFLPAGQETVFVGCTEAISCPPLLANEVDVRDGAASPLLTFSDPSHDRLTENDKPLAGAVSFTVPLSGSYIISTTGGRGWLLRLATGEGQEARALAAWAVVAALGLVLMVTELVAVVLYVRVRHLARRASA